MKLHELDPGAILAVHEERCEAVTTAELNAANLDADFKAFEASAALAYRDTGMSIAEAEKRVKASENWTELYKEMQAAHIRASAAKRDLRRAEMAADLYRTEAANRRNV